jgi:small subunit ribosomal protein S6
MTKYELAVVFVPTFEEEAFTAELEKITSLVTRHGGEIEKVDNWGKRRTAYEIKDHNEGIFCFITFTAEPTAPLEIEQRIRIMEPILRYLIIKQD